MYYSTIHDCDIANGTGVRVTLFVSGCTNCCEGCFQPETWDFGYGKDFDDGRTPEEHLFSLLWSINGIAGIEGWEEHAKETGTMISEINASYVSLLTLMLDPSAPIMKDIRDGKIHLLTPEQVLGETYLMLKTANPKKTCVFRSNHASNYVSLRGDLPKDKEDLLKALKMAMENTGLIKDERFRAL